jgi:hypothetical protein
VSIIGEPLAQVSASAAGAAPAGRRTWLTRGRRLLRSATVLKGGRGALKFGAQPFRSIRSGPISWRARYRASWQLRAFKRLPMLVRAGH